MTRRRRHVVAGCVLAVILAPAVGRAAGDLLLREITVVDGTGGPARSGVDVLVRNGRIAAIAPERLDADGAEVVDGRGRFVVPGLFDAHTHPFPVDESFPQFVRFGVTSILVTGCGDCDDATLAAMRERTLAPGAAAPRFFHTSQHFTMAGRHPVKTYPSPKWVDGVTVHYIDSVAEIGPLVARVSRQPIVGIKLTIEEGPDPPFVERMPQEFIDEIVRQAHIAGTRVFAHVSDSEELRMAARAGVDHLLHFTGVDVDWERDGELVAELVSRDVHWVTTIMIDKAFLYPQHPEWVAAVAATGMYDAELARLAGAADDPEAVRAFAQRLYGEPAPSFATNPVLRKQFSDLKRLHEAGIRLVAGTDVGSDWIFPGYSLHEELALLAAAGFTPDELLVMATRNAAGMIGVLDDVGTLEPGKRADLLVLDADPRTDVGNLGAIAAVYRDGVAVWTDR